MCCFIYFLTHVKYNLCMCLDAIADVISVYGLVAIFIYLFRYRWWYSEHFPALGSVPDHDTCDVSEHTIGDQL